MRCTSGVVHIVFQICGRSVRFSYSDHDLQMLAGPVLCARAHLIPVSLYRWTTTTSIPNILTLPSFVQVTSFKASEEFYNKVDAADKQFKSVEVRASFLTSTESCLSRYATS